LPKTNKLFSLYAQPALFQVENGRKHHTLPQKTPFRTFSTAFNALIYKLKNQLKIDAK